MKLDIQRFATPKLVIETLLDKEGFEKGLNKIQGIAKTGFKGLAMSVGVAATALTGLVSKSVKAAGELEQQMGGTEAVFKEYAKTVQGMSKAAFTNMGLSANQYMATINKMGSLMQGSGISIEKSMNLSAKAMQRAADVASIMGIDIESAMESIAGAAKGNFTMMDNLGVAMNATTIEAYALSKGIKTSYNEMTNAQKIELAMEMFLEKSAYAMDNYAKENATFAGSLTTLKASMENFLSGAGDINELIESAVNFGGILVKSIGEAAPRIVEGIIQLVNDIIPQIPDLLNQLLPVVIDGAVSLITGLAKSIPTILPILFDAIIQAFESIVDILPQVLDALLKATIEIMNALAAKLPDLIPKIVDGILALIPVLIQNLPLFINAGMQLILGLAKGLVEAIPDLIKAIPQIITDLVMALTEPNTIIQMYGASLEIILALGKGLIEAIPQLLMLVPRLISSLANNISERVRNTNWGEIGKNILKGILDGFGRINDYLTRKVNEFKNAITSKFKSIFGIHSPSRLMRDEIGVFLAEGIGEGFEDEIDNVYRSMQNAIDFEQSKLQANVETGKVFNTLQNSTPIAIDINAPVELDGTKVGRLITPVVSKTIKTGGGV